MKPIRQSLGVGIQSRTSSTAKDARIVNGYVETIDGVKWVVKRPGTFASTVTPVLPTGVSNGLYAFNGKLYAGINLSLFEIVPVGITPAVAVASSVRAVNGAVLNKYTLN
jgi:hypothetical protein